MSYDADTLPVVDVVVVAFVVVVIVVVFVFVDIVALHPGDK